MRNRTHIQKIAGSSPPEDIGSEESSYALIDSSSSTQYELKE